MEHDSLRLECLSLPAVREDMPFGPDTLVFKVGGKMFALLSLDAWPPSINLKCDPDRSLELRERYSAIAPGYHMNKKHWNTLTFDGSLSAPLTKELIAHSYSLVRSSLPKAVQATLDSD